MALQVTPYTLPLAVCGVAFVAVSVRLARRTDDRSSATFLAVPLLAATAVWTLGYAAELSATTRATQLLFARVQYVGNAFTPLLWFGYVLAYVGHADAVDRRWWAALAVPPVAVVALAVTYPATDLLWTSVETVRTRDFAVLVTDHGVLFYAFIAYVYSLVAATTVLLARRVRNARGLYRRQALALLAGSLAPALAGIVYVAGASPVPGLNLPALAFVVTGFVVLWSAQQSGLFTVEPVAWETAVGQLDDPVFVVDTEHRVVAANDAGRSFTDVTVGQPAADALGDVFDEPYWSRPGDHEFGAHKDGATRVYDLSVTPVERRGTHLGNVLVMRDVTERYRREERLSEFASVVSHDLRNPLNVARGHLELGRETGDDDHFAETDEALERMERIIEDLLTLAREGESEPDGEERSLAATARTAWTVADSLDADARLEIGDDRTLVADETALLRLLENLFRNSAEHGSVEDRDEPVTVTVGATDDGFFVADDGPGIPAEERDTVFDRGYTTSEDGTGFGLAIVSAVAEAHDWSVAASESDSGGARFDVTVE
ncbi:sensor histidine kinase [Halobacterium litoreum]|uniref:histidine kinase n=1 Tax=Halobacterium litoreum TaxID=2039234 RepID=A0ABD5NDJ4_9EURY|nr:histidine kinase N-terminal 7TM domain-containing protein [Halobacterium litoreum]UHH13875.1 ATP-binding protein [Halobacterium litoreum]